MFGLCGKAYLLYYISELFKLLFMKLQAKATYMFTLFLNNLCNLFVPKGYRCLFLIAFYT